MWKVRWAVRWPPEASRCCRDQCPDRALGAPRPSGATVARSGEVRPVGGARWALDPHPRLPRTELLEPVL